MALGSQRTGIVGLVVGSGLKLALIGCAIGVAGAWAAAQTLQRFLFGVRALDPVTLALAAAALLLLTVAACLLPAWRAASVELSQALRAE
jgi:putative ABC transport system permease protein